MEQAEYQAREYALECAIQLNHKGADSDQVITDAKKFYGFLFPENGELKSIDKAPVKPSPAAKPVKEEIKPLPQKTKPVKMEIKKLAPDPIGNVNQTITPRALDILQAIINLNKEKILATRKAIHERTGVTGNNQPLFLKPLLKAGYVEEFKPANTRALAYKALKNLDGQPLHQMTKDEKTGITKCPPAYAEGYGFKKSSLEEV